MSIYCDDTLCIRNCDTSCTRCEIACPVHAISFNESQMPRINEHVCTQCGICMSICDVFNTPTLSYERLVSHIQKIALRGDIVYLTCQKHIPEGTDIAANVVVLPCLAFVSYELFTLLLAQNIPLCITCDFNTCQTCDIAPQRGELLFSKAITYAQELTDKEIRYQKSLPQEISFEKDFALHDRREIFSNITNETKSVLGGTKSIKDFDVLQQQAILTHKQETAKALNLPTEHVIDATSSGKVRHMSRGKKMLLEAQYALPHIGTRAQVKVSKVADHVSEKYTEEVRLEGAAVCAYGARFLDEHNNAQYDARYCTACSTCVNATHNDIEICYVELSQLATLA